MPTVVLVPAEDVEVAVVGALVDVTVELPVVVELPTVVLDPGVVTVVVGTLVDVTVELPVVVEVPTGCFINYAATLCGRLAIESARK